MGGYNVCVGTSDSQILRLRLCENEKEGKESVCISESVLCLVLLSPVRRGFQDLLQQMQRKSHRKGARFFPKGWGESCILTTRR